jgi:type I restriction enzyme S subunit
LPSEGIAVIDESEFHISSKAFNSARQLPKGSVVVSCIGIIGKVGILNKQACTNQQINAIIPNDTILPKCLAYIICNNKRELEQIANAPIVPIINKSEFSKFSIPVPPLSEQQSIVVELDKINELISLKKAQLSDLDSLAQSIFYDMFGDPIENEKGWEVKKLGEMSSVKTGPFGSMLHKEDYISNGIPLVNPIHIKDYRVIADMDFTISDEKARELNAYILRKNDVIFARRGDIGRCAVISDKENGYLCGTGSLFVRFEQKVIPQYIMYIIRSSSFIKELISKAKGATMLNLNSTTIAALGIPLPPLSLQQEFAKRIELIEQQKVLIKQSIKEVETLFNSRMDYYFN